jgi:hypothetical protein
VKVAAVCLAYLRTPAGVEMLARYFARLPADVYLHVDAKVPDGAYRGVAARHPHVRLLPRRLPIWWGGFNTVRAVVAALRHVRTQGGYDRHLLLTEDTVPLMPPAALRAHLEQDVEFIQSYPVPTDAGHLVRRRYDGFFFYDSAATNPRFLPPEMRGIAEGMVHNLQRLEAVRRRGKAPLPDLRTGSTWWGLSDQAVACILDAHEADPALRECFEFSAIPEEQYFPTLLHRAGWTRAQQSFMHADFTREPFPYVYRTRQEVEQAQCAPCCMLRKVDLQAPGIAEYMRDLTQAPDASGGAAGPRLA